MRVLGRKKCVFCCFCFWGCCLSAVCDRSLLFAAKQTARPVRLVLAMKKKTARYHFVQKCNGRLVTKS